MKYITKSLILSAVISRKMDTNDPQQLDNIKDRLKDRLGIPVGLHMSGLPLLASMILAMLSFALAQPYLWLMMFDLFGLPQYAVMAAIVPVALIYSLLMVLAMYFVARGNYLALKFFLALMVISGLTAVIYLISACLPVLFGAGQKVGFLVSAILGISFAAASAWCMNSRTFYRANVLFLHNRVWRKQQLLYGMTVLFL